MAALADHSLGDLLEQVAARTPAPGGGCAAAWACALGAGLVEMAASFTLARRDHAEIHERMAEVRDRAGQLRRQAVALAERELTSYAPVLAALRLPAGDPERERRRAAALSDAADPPFATAEAAADVAALGAEAARSGTAHLKGDAVAATVLAEAACSAAARLVELNLAEWPHDERLARLPQLVRSAVAARAEALG